MMKAFVLVITSPGHMENVLKKIRRIAGITEAYMLYGIYDIIAVIQAETIAKLKEKILKIRRIDFVESTITMKVVD